MRSSADPQGSIPGEADRPFRIVTDDSGHGRKSVTFRRNERSRSTGTAGHVHPESVVTRARNTHMGEQVIDALQVGSKHDRFCRGMMPGKNSDENPTGFFYMTLAAPNPLPPGGYDQYRFIRRTMMQIYAMDFLQKDRRIDCVVGIASEPASLPAGVTGRSEDLIYVGQQEWTDEMVKSLELDRERFDIARPGRVRGRAVQGNEFPDVPTRRAAPRYQPTMNRAARRKAAAKARKK